MKLGCRGGLNPKPAIRVGTSSGGGRESFPNSRRDVPTKRRTTVLALQVPVVATRNRSIAFVVGHPSKCEIVVDEGSEKAGRRLPQMDAIGTSKSQKQNPAVHLNPYEHHTNRNLVFTISSSGEVA